MQQHRGGPAGSERGGDGSADAIPRVLLSVRHGTKIAHVEWYGGRRRGRRCAESLCGQKEQSRDNA